MYAINAVVIAYNRYFSIIYIIFPTFFATESNHTTYTDFFASAKRPIILHCIIIAVTLADRNQTAYLLSLLKHE